MCYICIFYHLVLGLPSIQRKQRWEKLNAVLSKHQGKNGTASFSNMKNEMEMKNMLATFVSPYHLEEKFDLPEQNLETLFNVISVCNDALYVKSHSESKLTHVIFFILAIICIEVKATISLEERVTGKQVKASGAFEILIRHGDVMCAVTECKKGDFEGVVQGLLDSEVICDLELLDRSLCIVTNYKHWIFYDNCQDYIFRYEYNLEMEGLMMPKKESLKHLTGLLVTFLRIPSSDT